MFTFRFMKAILSALLLLSALQVISQTSNDFKVESQIHDTLVWGYQNFITVKTEFDYSKIQVEAKGMSISKMNDSTYIAKVTMSNKESEFIILYDNGREEPLKFTYHFKSTIMDDALIRRFKAINAVKENETK